MSITTPQPASIPRRLAALLYDLLIVLALLLVVALSAQLATQARLIGMHGGHAQVPLLYQLLQLGVVCAYFVLSWTLGGQTIGARAWRLRVVAVGTSAAPRVGRALLRAGSAALPLLALLLGYLWAPRVALLAVAALWLIDYAALLFDRARRTLHDRFSGTQMVRLPH
ncbi:MAG: RDD family protein [Metallibacterium sp.]